ncbi:MAG: aminoacyl-tRNA hydrolase [Pseudomonadota bacterium]
MKDESIEVIVGLGNPGAEHLMDRHNAGFWFVDVLSRRYSSNFRQEKKFHGEVCRINIDGHGVWLLKPTTYMNDSGRAIRGLLDYQKIPASRCLVVHDELDLPTGIIRFKKAGGHGGHNGLRSTIAHVGKDFIRLRVGVGHPGSKERVTNHVLGRASRDQEDLIMDAINDGADAMPILLDKGLQRATHKLHNREKKSKESNDETKKD